MICLNDDGKNENGGVDALFAYENETLGNSFASLLLYSLVYADRLRVLGRIY
jgi:hypothetical protein